MATLPPTTLTLVKGSSLSFELIFYDENDQLENLAGATAAIVNWKSDAVVTASQVIRKTALGNLVLSIPLSKLTGTLTQVEADALAVGTFIGQATVAFTAAFHKTLPFTVIVLPAISPNS